MLILLEVNLCCVNMSSCWTSCSPHSGHVLVSSALSCNTVITWYLDLMVSNVRILIQNVINVICSPGAQIVLMIWNKRITQGLNIPGLFSAIYHSAASDQRCRCWWRDGRFFLLPPTPFPSSTKIYNKKYINQPASQRVFNRGFQ